MCVYVLLLLTACAQVLHFVQQGTGSPLARVRLLAATLLGHLARGTLAHDVVPPLTLLLADSNTHVAAAAMRALMGAATQPSGIAALLAPTGLASLGYAERPAAVRLRVSELAARVARVNDDATAAVAAAGLLTGLQSDLKSHDVVVALAALETLAQLAESDEAATGLGTTAMSVVPALLQTICNSNADLMLRNRSLVCVGRIAGAAAQPPPEVVHVIAGVVRDEDTPPGLRIAAMEAFGLFGETVAGAETALCTDQSVIAAVAVTAFSGGAGVVVAMHTLATLAGAERPAGAELFSCEAETALQDGVRAGLAGARGSPILAEALFRQLQRRGPTFLEARNPVCLPVSS